MSVCTVVGNSEPVVGFLEKKYRLRVERVDQRATQIYFDGPSDLAELRQELAFISNSHGIDVAVQSAKNLQKKLVVFDMDSTLIQNECIDLIAKRAGVEKQVAEITESAMRGELDFSQSLAERVSLLKGIPTTIYSDIIEEISLTEGARELCQRLKAEGVKLAVLSGGFQPIVDWIKQELNLDYAYANHLVAENNKLAGKTEGLVVDGARKAVLLQEIAAKEEIPLELVAAVGDGSNDLPMMGVAGFGIAWHAKPVVQEKAPSRMNGSSLANALYYLGYSR